MASGLFARQGYRETSMRQIALECALSKPTLYYYFHGKGEMLLALLQRCLQELDVSTVEVWRAPSLEEALERFALEYFKAADRNNAREWFALFMNECTKQEEVREAFRRIGVCYEENIRNGIMGRGWTAPADRDRLEMGLSVFLGALLRYNLDRVLGGGGLPGNGA